MTNPIGGMSPGDINKMVGDAAKPNLEAANKTNQTAQSTLAASAGSAATKPTEATAASSGTPAPSGAAGSTVAGAVDPNNPGTGRA